MVESGLRRLRAGGVNRICRSRSTAGRRTSAGSQPPRGCSTATSDIPRHGMSSSRPRGRFHEHFAPLMAGLGGLTTYGVSAAPRQRRSGLHQPGDHLLGLCRPARRREDLPVRPDPAPGLGRRVEDAGSRAAPADPGPQPVPVRRLSRPADPARRGRPGGPGAAVEAATARRWSGSSRRAGSISTWSAPT